jgi:hypothetical protein
MHLFAVGRSWCWGGVSLALVSSLELGGARGRSKFSYAGAVVCSSDAVAFAEAVVAKRVGSDSVPGLAMQTERLSLPFTQGALGGPMQRGGELPQACRRLPASTASCCILTPSLMEVIILTLNAR